MIVVANKMVLYTHKFSFAITLTALHALFTAAGMAAMAAGGLFEHRQVPLARSAPIAAVYVGFIVFNNLSIQLNTVGAQRRGPPPTSGRELLRERAPAAAAAWPPRVRTASVAGVDCGHCGRSGSPKQAPLGASSQRALPARGGCRWRTHCRGVAQTSHPSRTPPCTPTAQPPPLPQASTS